MARGRGGQQDDGEYTITRIVGEFKKSESTKVRVALAKARGTEYVDIRTMVFNSQVEEWRPSKGFTIPSDQWQDLWPVLEQMNRIQTCEEE